MPRCRAGGEDVVLAPELALCMVQSGHTGHQGPDSNGNWRWWRPHGDGCERWGVAGAIGEKR